MSSQILTTEKFKGDGYLVKFLHYMFLYILDGDECTLPESHWNDAFMKVCCPSLYRMIQWKHQPKAQLDIIYLFKKSWFPSPLKRVVFKIILEFIWNTLKSFAFTCQLCLYLSSWNTSTATCSLFVFENLYNCCAPSKEHSKCEAPNCHWSYYYIIHCMMFLYLLSCFYSRNGIIAK